MLSVTERAASKECSDGVMLQIWPEDKKITPLIIIQVSSDELMMNELKHFRLNMGVDAGLCHTVKIKSTAVSANT